MWDKAWFFSIAVLVACLLKFVASEKNFRKVKFHAYFFTFYFLSSFVAACVWPLFLGSPRNVKHLKLGASLCKDITKLFNLKWELRNKEILSEDRGAIIACNHQSTIDILGMFNVWEIADKLTAVAKREILYVFPMGPVCYLAGLIFIDRGNRKKAMEQLQKSTELTVQNKTKIWLFPEGTRNRDRSKLLPFKKGAFHMAVSSQVPIIPIVISPYYFINEKEYIFNRGGYVVIKCLEPIPTNGLTEADIPSLVDKVHTIMETEYLKLSKEVLEKVKKST